MIAKRSVFVLMAAAVRSARVQGSVAAGISGGRFAVTRCVPGGAQRPVGEAGLCTWWGLLCGSAQASLEKAPKLFVVNGTGPKQPIAIDDRTNRLFGRVRTFRLERLRP